MAQSGVALADKLFPTSEDARERLGPLVVKYCDVALERNCIVERLQSLGEAVWTPRGQSSNVRLQRAFHDDLGVKQVILIFCDDLLQRSFEMPWWEDWRDLLMPLFVKAGVTNEEQVVRCLFAKLPVGVEIPAHHDTGLWTTRTHRMHIPLVTSCQDGPEETEVVFRAGISEAAMERYKFEEGAIVELNNRAKHAVKNNWDQDRIHLIFDFLEPEDYVPRWKLDANAEIFQTRRAIFLKGERFYEEIRGLSPEDLTKDERIKRSQLIMERMGDVETFRRFQNVCIAFKDGELPAIDFVFMVRQFLGKELYMEVMESSEMELPKLIQDMERRHALLQEHAAVKRPIGTFVVIGAMKCGTTSLYEYIVQHHRVVRAHQKEPHVLDWKWDAVSSWQMTEKQIEVSKSLCEDPVGDLGVLNLDLRYKYLHAFNVKKILKQKQKGEFVVAGEASPSYLLGGRKVAERLRSAFPDVRLLVVLRDPVKRAHSHFQMTRDSSGNENQMKRRGHVKGMSFSELIEEDLQRLREHNLLDPNLDENGLDCFEREYLEKAPLTHGGHSYVGRGLYAFQIELWLQVFPREQFLFLRLDDLSKHTNQSMRQVFEFLHVESMTEIEDISVKNARTYEPMDGAIKQQLEEFYRPYNERLVRLLGPGFNFS